MPAPAAGECCVEFEWAIDQILALLRNEYNTEKNVSCNETHELPCIPDQMFYFGLPTKLATPNAVAVIGIRQEFVEPIRARQSCPVMQRSYFEIHWWNREPKFDCGQRILMRMGEVIKRIIIRNPEVRFCDGIAQLPPLQIDEIMFNVDPVEAYSGSRYKYGHGIMSLHVDMHISLIRKESC